MNNIELRMVEVLKELKEKYNIVGIKSEFEAEGVRAEELIKLNTIVYSAGLESTIKIGGCEAVSDMDYAKVIGAKGIMAPMIETPFAMRKFKEAFEKVYGPKEKSGKITIINIETKTAVQNLKEILDEAEGFLDVVCVGRVDLSASLGLSRADINGEVIFSLVYNISREVKKRGISMTIGGGISPEAIPFLQAIGNNIDRFETRKIMFPVDGVGENYNEAIKLSMEFELLLLKNKRELYLERANEDLNRLEMLEKRFNSL